MIRICMKDSYYVIVDKAGNIVGCSHKPLLDKVAVRSVAKPIQSLPVLLLGLHKKYHLTKREIAVLSSSQLAQSQQVAAICSVMRKTGLREEELIVSPECPAGRIAFEKWQAAGGEKLKRYHPCVGNHIALALAQRELTGSTQYYYCFESAIQKEVLRLMGVFCECSSTDIIRIIDGCGIPSFVLTMKQVAVAYRNLVCPSDRFNAKYTYACRKNLAAIWSNPLMLEGDGCLSTIISAERGTLAKTGQEGILAIGLERIGYGIAIQSSTKGWAEVADTAMKILNEYGEPSRKRSKELRKIAGCPNV